MVSNSSMPYDSNLTNNKPLEIYLFIDPFCLDCWSLAPIISKLQMEYGDYFTLKYVLCGKLDVLNKKISNISEDQYNSNCHSREIDHSSDKCVFLPHLAAISIKAAELQGKRAGIRFIRRLQELLFVENKDITDINVLQHCAQNIGLDLDEFIRDIYSPSAAKAFQCDVRISAEMEVNEMPAMVFFNENIEDEGLKITGLYSYDIYVQVLTELLECKPKPAEKPPLELFLSINPIIAVQDLAMIYDQPVHKIERQMKQLQLQRKAQKLQAKNGPVWKYTSKCLY
ncbi:ClpXP adapter SpxH family protein [Lederbergia graminis]|uniref:ClpXP adapter protein SpxH n=1 Tax=Lederbergia graminis TaxID=735518 RepID=A0ABW0LDP1_9BACI|nr:ClpXP adapter SpxH family protein [Paenibacillus bovis]HLU21131.1 ClpXP adapter SpxH family protein [Bacillaceae bacterium]